MTAPRRRGIVPAHRMIPHGIIPFCAAALCFLAALPAHAHKRDFAFTYEWWTAAKGEKEIEVWNSYGTKDKEYQGQIEFETGLTDRLTGSLYVLREKAQGESGVNGLKTETRYRFGDFAEAKFLPAAYLEVEKVKGESTELEGKAIFSRFVGDSNLSFNLIANRSLESGARTDTGYALGYSRATPNPKLRIGVESTGSFREKTYGLGPTFAYDVNPQTRAVLGTNFALNNSTDNVIRLLVEYEFF